MEAEQHLGVQRVYQWIQGENHCHLILMYTLQVHAYGYQSFIYYILKCKMFLTCRNLWLTSPTTSEHFPWKIPLACTCKRNYLFANLQSILVTDLFCFEFIVTFFNSKKQTKNCNTHCFISFKSHKKCSSSVLLLVNCL